MAIPVDPERIYEYVLERDRDLHEDQQSVFLARPLRAREDAAIDGKCSRLHVGGMVELKTSERALETLHCCLEGWRNFPPGSGENAGFVVAKPRRPDVALSRRLSESTMDSMDLAARLELYSWIARDLGSEGVDAGKSGGPSQP